VHGQSLERIGHVGGQRHLRRDDGVAAGFGIGRAIGDRHADDQRLVGQASRSAR
jgi:hypothetical protein